MPKTHLLSESVEEYLEAIHRLSEDASGASTTSLARRLSVTPASVTGMLRRLRELGFISYRRYRDIVLTDEGQQRAHDLIRRHRLAERLLTDILKVPLSEVHDEACRLEHVVSPQLEQRISDALGAPEACPHGHPIELHAPDRTLSLLERAPQCAAADRPTQQRITGGAAAPGRAGPAAGRRSSSEGQKHGRGHSRSRIRGRDPHSRPGRC